MQDDECPHHFLIVTGAADQWFRRFENEMPSDMIKLRRNAKMTTFAPNTFEVCLYKVGFLFVFQID